MAIDRRLLLNIEWSLVGTTLALLAIGVTVIFSATHNGRLAGLEVRQLYAIALGFVLLIVCLSIDYRRLVDRAPLFYLMALAVLVYVLVAGTRVAGTKRWILLGPLQIQPSEFVKLVTALLVAKIFSEMKKDSLGLSDLIGPGLAVGTLMLLIAAEPDLGTAVTLVPIFMTAALLAGLRAKALGALVLVGVVAGAVGWQFARPYQKERVYNFLDPGRDPR